jgi:hypothetical protein
MGQYLIIIAFGAALLSSISYFSVHFGKTRNIRFGRFFFHVAAIGTISSAVPDTYSPVPVHLCVGVQFA